MIYEKSAGAVILRKEGDRFYYLLLCNLGASKKSKKHFHWNFPRGHIERGESETQTLKREVEEESGIKDIEIVPGFREVIKYFFVRQGKGVLKTAVFYLAKTKTKEVTISDEHVGYKWLVYDSALKQISFKNARSILEKANKFFSEKSV
jgi:8-oxo-dGTP pyrophosphatase MutT (NUDIX family)